MKFDSTWLRVIGGVLLLATLVGGSVWYFVSSPGDALVQCSQSATSASSPTTAQPAFPIMYEGERTISPRNLRAPDGVRILSPAGSSEPVVALTYETTYLNALRTQAGVAFRGIAPLDPVSVPESVKASYPSDTEYVIAPNSCK